MRLITRFFVVAVIVLMATQSFGQQDQAVVKNDDVTKMISAGLGDDVVVAMISSSRTNFDTSIEAILLLKESGVSDAVLAAMIGAGSATSETTAVVGREAGIYLETGESELTILEPSVFSSQRSGGWASGLTRAIPRGRKASIRLPQSYLRLPTTSPVFYFYFERSGAGLSNTGSTGLGAYGSYGPGMFSGFMSAASSPNEFVLVRLERKDNEREMELGREWVFGDKSGVQTEDVVHFDFERLEPGVYRITFPRPLEAGEYAFFYAAGAGNLEGGTGKLFDFGLDVEVADSGGNR